MMHVTSLSIHEALAGILSPSHVWLEAHDSDGDAIDVIVQMENGAVYTAMFVVVSYLRRQMDLSYEVTRQIEDTPPVRYVAIDTPHILVDTLDRDTIEDTIDNLIAQDIFECHFTRLTEDQAEESQQAAQNGKRATQEVAAAVIADVLVVRD